MYMVTKAKPARNILTLIFRRRYRNIGTLQVVWMSRYGMVVNAVKYGETKELFAFKEVTHAQYYNIKEREKILKEAFHNSGFLLGKDNTVYEQWFSHKWYQYCTLYDQNKHKKGATTMGDEAEYLEQQNIDDYFDDPEEGDDD